jgi:hypothetical protein
MSYDRELANRLGEMHTQYSDQYRTSCVVPCNEKDPDKIIKHCRTMGALFYEDGPNDECFVVVLRPEIGPELYTEKALRQSLNLGGNQ